MSNGGGGTLSWTAAIPESVDWARIRSGSSGTNSGTIEIQIEANTGAAREFVLTVSASGAGSRTVTVRQAEAPTILVLSAPATRLDGEGGSIALQVHFNGGGSVPIANGLATRGAIMQPTQAQDPVT